MLDGGFVLEGVGDDSRTISDLAFVERVHARLMLRAIDPQTLRRSLMHLERGTSRDELALAMRLTTARHDDDADIGDAPSLQAMMACPTSVFLTQAFHRLLGRAPDLDGALAYLRALRAGRHRLAILAALRHSEEGVVQGSRHAVPWPLADLLRVPATPWTVKAMLLLLAWRHRWRRR